MIYVDKASEDLSDYRLADRLLWETRYNRWTAFFNHASQASGSVFQGRIQPLFQFPIDFAWGWYRSSQCTPRERKSLFLFNRHIRKNPWIDNLEETGRIVERLERKRVSQLVKQEYRLGCSFAKTGNHHRALFHLQNALELDPKSHKIEKKISYIKSEIAKRKRMSLNALTVLEGENFFLSSEEKRDYRRIIYSLVISENRAIREHVSSFISLFPQSNYCDDMKYTGILLDAPSYGSDRMDGLRRLSRVYPGTNSSNRALDLLKDTDFHPFLNLEKQEHRYNADVRRYLFLGKRPLEEQVYLVSGSVVQSPGSSMMDIGLFFLLDIGFRSVDCLLGNPIPRDDVLYALCLYERKYPENPQIISLRERISRLYARQKNYARALEFARKAGDFPQERIRKLSDKKAKHLYYMILEEQDLERKITNLRRLISLFPDAPIRKKADKSLDRFIKEDLYEFRISRVDLKTCPDLWDKAILDLDPILLDGKRDNGEISDEGILAIKDGPVCYRMKNEAMTREISLSPEIRQLVHSEIQFRGLGDEQKSKKGKERERQFPLEISGGVGTGGWEVYPSFVPVPYTEDDLDLFQ